jgi:Transposase DDE domain group 1
MEMTNETVCKPKRLEFQVQNSRSVVVEFGGESISTEGGAVLIREVAERTGVLRKFASCFEDFRNPDLIEHTKEELISQRIYGLVCGYEDLNDHTTLREDKLFSLLVGKDEVLASRSTLNRVELTRDDASPMERYKKLRCDMERVDRFFVSAFLAAQPSAPEQIILDFDATDIPLYGEQENRFFHGYYGHYCYLPLYCFAGDFPLGMRLRPSNIDASEGTVEELERIVPLIREQFPTTRILVRGDSGFARESIMSWCEQNGVDYLLGLARNARLEAEIAPLVDEAERLFIESGDVHGVRLFHEFRYQTLDTWSRERRVIAKAEYLPKGPNPRFVVTSLDRSIVDAVSLYEQWYCKRGDMENRIKEQLQLFADRMSCSHMRANQIRLYFSGVAYLLMVLFRQIALHDTEFERAQVATIRTKIIKIGARVIRSARRFLISLSEGFPYQHIVLIAHARLCAT